MCGFSPKVIRKASRGLNDIGHPFVEDHNNCNGRSVRVLHLVPLDSSGALELQFHWPAENDQVYPDIFICILLACFTMAFLRRRLPVIWVATVLLTLWSVIHLFEWWIPYAQDSVTNYARYRFYAPTPNCSQ